VKRERRGNRWIYVSYISLSPHLSLPPTLPPPTPSLSLSLSLSLYLSLSFCGGANVSPSSRRRFENLKGAAGLEGSASFHLGRLFTRLPNFFHPSMPLKIKVGFVGSHKCFPNLKILLLFDLPPYLAIFPHASSRRQCSVNKRNFRAISRRNVAVASRLTIVLIQPPRETRVRPSSQSDPREDAVRRLMKYTRIESEDEAPLVQMERTRRRSERRRRGVPRLGPLFLAGISARKRSPYNSSSSGCYSQIYRIELSRLGGIPAENGHEIPGARPRYFSSAELQVQERNDGCILSRAIPNRS